MKKKFWHVSQTSRVLVISDLPTWIYLLNKPPSLDAKEKKTKGKNNTTNNKKKKSKKKFKKEMLSTHSSKDKLNIQGLVSSF